MLARAKPILIVAAALVLLLSGCVSDSEVQELRQRVSELEQTLATRPPPLETPPTAPVRSIPLSPSSWTLTEPDGSSLSFDSTGVTLEITSTAPIGTKVFIEATDELHVGPDEPWIVEVEARVDFGPGGFDGNETANAQTLGMNVPGTNSFFHWHANQGHGSYFYGDWSEVSCAQTSVPLDDKWHTFRLEHDGTDRLLYYLDGRLICDQWRVNETQVPTGPLVPRIYLQNLKETGQTMSLSVRTIRFAYGADAVEISAR